MTLLLFSCFFLGGSTTKIDDFIIILIPLIYLLFSNRFRISNKTLIICLLLFSLFLIGGVRRSIFEINAFLVTVSLLYTLIIVSFVKSYSDKVFFKIDKQSILVVWVCISLYCITLSIMDEDRLSSPGVYLLGEISDSHIFSAQYAILSSILVIALNKMRWLVVIIATCVSILIGSRSGLFIFYTFLIAFVFQNIGLKNFILYSFFALCGMLALVISLDVIDFSQFRALQFGTVSDTHRFGILKRAFKDIMVLDILIGDDQAYTGGRKYYDNFLISVFLLIGLFGTVIFFYGLFSTISLMSPGYVLIIFVALLPLSDFLLIPRFQFLIFVLLLYGSARRTSVVN